MTYSIYYGCLDISEINANINELISSIFQHLLNWKAAIQKLHSKQGMVYAKQ